MDTTESTRAPGESRYRSPLRQRQAQQTRALIMDAFAELVVAQGTSRVTMAAVAERAEVSERTVYRHFPTSASLLDALSDRASAAMREHGTLELARQRLPEAFDGVADLYAGFEAAGAPLKAAIIAGLAEGYRNPRQAQRVEWIRHALADELPGLSEDELDETVVLLRFQIGAWAWYLLTEREGLTTQQAAQLSARAARALIEDLRRSHADRSGRSVKR